MFAVEWIGMYTEGKSCSEVRIINSTHHAAAFGVFNPWLKLRTINMFKHFRLWYLLYYRVQSNSLMWGRKCEYNLGKGTMGAPVISKHVYRYFLRDSFRHCKKPIKLKTRNRRWKGNREMESCPVTWYAFTQEGGSQPSSWQIVTHGEQCYSAAAYFF